MQRGRLLLVAQDPHLREDLEDPSYEIEWIGEPSQLRRCRQTGFDAAVLDIDREPRDAGISVCRRMSTLWPDTPVVVITGSPELDTVVGAMRSGAYDVLSKPIAADLLRSAVDRAIRRRLERHEPAQAPRRYGTAEVAGFLGKSRPMRDLHAMIDHVAGADISAVVVGESGTGKELVARAIHDRSPHRDRPFVGIDCGAVPATMLESELFGHVRGAFTSAQSSRTGLFLHADGGTLLLDEIGEMPLEMQAKLLRVLEERVVRPVGGETERPFDARIIAATNRHLGEEVRAGRFREDLYYRLNVVQIDVPPLRARGDDILLLVEAFVADAALRNRREPPTVSPEAERKLLRYQWPGNVRELQNAIERAVALCQDDELRVRDLPKSVRSFVPSSMHTYGCLDELASLPPLREVEQSYVAFVLDQVGGNKTHAAQVLGLDRRTLYRRLARFSRLDRQHGSLQ